MELAPYFATPNSIREPAVGLPASATAAARMAPSVSANTAVESLLPPFALCTAFLRSDYY